MRFHWYMSQYLLRISSWAGPAPGLFGPFVVDDEVVWSGDITLNYNAEAAFHRNLPGMKHHIARRRYETECRRNAGNAKPSLRIKLPCFIPDLFLHFNHSQIPSFCGPSSLIFLFLVDAGNLLQCRGCKSPGGWGLRAGGFGVRWMDS